MQKNSNIKRDTYLYEVEEVLMAISKLEAVGADVLIAILKLESSEGNVLIAISKFESFDGVLTAMLKFESLEGDVLIATLKSESSEGDVLVATLEVVVPLTAVPRQRMPAVSAKAHGGLCLYKHISPYTGCG